MKDLLGVLLLLSLAGCVASHAAEAPQSEGGSTAASRDGHQRLQPPTAEAEEPEDLASEPYRERPRGKESRKGKGPSSRIAFSEPRPWPTPLPVGGRTAISLPARLAVAQVKGSHVEFNSGSLLELDSLLARDAEVRAVVALGSPTGSPVSIRQLAAQADTEGRDLLLLDVRRSAEASHRDGYLFFAKGGGLLAHYQVRPSLLGNESLTSEGSTQPDLVARIGSAYRRLSK